MGTVPGLPVTRSAICVSYVLLSKSLTSLCLHFLVHLQNTSLNYMIRRVFPVLEFLNEYVLRFSRPYLFYTRCLVP